MRPLADSLRRLGPEHRAVLLLVLLAVAGQGLRLALLPPSAPPGSFAAGPARSPAAQQAATRQVGPLKAGERVDADRAGAAELARVPGLGPGLARRIVAHRAAHGPFGGLAGLDAVPGVGPTLLGRIAPWLAFSGAPRGGLPAAAAPRPSADPLPDLNAADSVALLRYRGIGPAKAGRLVRWRALHGPFTRVADVARIPGIGAATAASLWAQQGAK